MAVNYTKLQNSLASELKITRVLTAVEEYAGLAASGTNKFRSLIQAANCYDPTVTEDNRAIGFDTNYYDTVLLPSMQTQYRNYRGVVQSQSGWSGVLAREINLSSADKSVLNYITYKYENINLGEIHVNDRIGPAGALYKQMVLDGQTIVSNYVQFAALAALGVTRGSLDSTLVANGNFLSNCHTGVLTFKCVNESTTAPQLQGYLTIAPNSNTGALPLGLPDGTKVVACENNLTVNKYFDDLRVGLTGFILNRPGLATPTITGDNVSTPLFSSVSVTTPYDGDCFKGQFYLRITRQAVSPIWLLEFFADSGLTQKVGALTTDTTAGNFTTSKTLAAGSVVTFTLNRANAATALTAQGQTESITIDIKTPRLGDTWTMVVTNNYNGQAATLIGKSWPIALPAVPVTGAACTSALAGAGAGNLSNGAYKYKITLVGPGGESPVTPVSNTTTVADHTTNGKIALSGIPVGGGTSGVTARNIYRTTAGGSSFLLVATISDNVTTTYTDNLADASLGAAAPTTLQWDDTLFTAFSIS